MSDSDELKILSKKKQRLSLGEAIRKKKYGEKEAKRKVTRTMVVRPDGIEWPEIGIEKKSELMDLLKTLLQPMKLPSRKVPLNEIRKVGAEKRGEFRREWALNEAIKVGFNISSYIGLRSSVALGVNCVSKGLESNQLIGVIIEKDVSPDIITKILVPIAEVKGVPIIAISGLSATFKEYCHMKCIAFGLKRSCEGVSHHFRPLFDLIESTTTDTDIIDMSSVSNPNSSNVSISPLLPSHSRKNDSAKKTIIDSSKVKEKVPGKKRKKSKAKFSGFIPLKIRKVTSGSNLQ